jgi:acyl-coenzyme A synthetase/AMP-(fatty) acid ligase
LTGQSGESYIGEYVQPRNVVVLKELPKTSIGRLKNSVLGKWLNGKGDAI